MIHSAIATPSSRDAELSAEHFAAIARLMQSEARIHLSPVKRTLVHSRLSRRLREQGMTSFTDYLRLVDEDPEERQAMVVALTTNHTHFFRESHHFDHLRDEALPLLRERVAAGAPVRLWSAGCSSGEEAYTMAMCLLGRSRAESAWTKRADLRILATDISPPMVEAVAEALYSPTDISAIPEDYRACWLQGEGESFRMADEARALVAPRVLNLFADWPMRQRYDVIFCRNVMIYFDETAQAELQARLIDQLAPGGFLYIGHSERLSAAALATMTSCGNTIYTKAGAAVR